MIVGSFVLFLTAGIFFFILWFSNGHISHNDRLYDIHFDKVITSIQPGSAVYYRGIRVGGVVEIRFAPNNIEKVLVRIKVDKSILLRDGVVAKIETAGFAGQPYIQLTGGTQGGKVLVAKSGQDYPIITASSSSLQSFLESTPELIHETTELMKKLNDLFKRENRREVEKTLQNIEKISDSLSNEETGLPASIRKFNAAMESFTDTSTKVGNLSENANEFVTNLNEQIDDLDALITNINKVAKSADKVINEDARQFLNTTSESVQQTADELRVFLQKMNEIANEVEKNPAQFILYGETQDEIAVP